jgi:hypothetical protein
MCSSKSLNIGRWTLGLDNITISGEMSITLFGIFLGIVLGLLCFKFGILVNSYFVLSENILKFSSISYVNLRPWL